MEVDQQEAALARITQLQLEHVVRNGTVPEWFHGVISRKIAEDLLLCRPPGSYLVRVSQSRIGYTLSYRAKDCCRHFMIDQLKNGLYNIVGENTYHGSLQDLVKFHYRVPILPYNDLLITACGKNKTSTDMVPAIQFSSSLPEFRSSSQGQAGISAPHYGCHPRLYPCLDTELATMTHKSSNTMVDVKPLPVPTKTLSSISFGQLNSEPPELPPRSFAPQHTEATSKTHCDVSSESQATQQSRSKKSKGLIHFPKKRVEGSDKPVKRAGAETSNAPGAEPSPCPFSALDGAITSARTRSENVYEELTGKMLDTEVTGIPVLQTDPTSPSGGQVLPAEYLHPPPFAPGY